jgi:hypothetical protein
MEVSFRRYSDRPVQSHKTLQLDTFRKHRARVRIGLFPLRPLDADSFLGRGPCGHLDVSIVSGVMGHHLVTAGQAGACSDHIQPVRRNAGRPPHRYRLHKRTAEMPQCTIWFPTTITHLSPFFPTKSFRNGNVQYIHLDVHHFPHRVAVRWSKLSPPIIMPSTSP